MVSSLKETLKATEKNNGWEMKIHPFGATYIDVDI